MGATVSCLFHWQMCINRPPRGFFKSPGPPLHEHPWWTPASAGLSGKGIGWGHQGINVNSAILGKKQPPNWKFYIWCKLKMHETSSQFGIRSNQVNTGQRDHPDWFHQQKRRSGLGVNKLSCYPVFLSRVQAGESHSIMPPCLLAVTWEKPPSCCLWRLHSGADIAEKTPSLDEAQ